MDWKNIIAGLTRAGYSQQQIAAEVGCSQVRVCQLAKGNTEPLYSVGSKLVQMHDRVSASTSGTEAVSA